MELSAGCVGATIGGGVSDGSAAESGIESLGFVPRHGLVVNIFVSYNEHNGRRATWDGDAPGRTRTGLRSCPPAEEHLPDQHEQLGRDEDGDSDLEDDEPPLLHQVDHQLEVVLHDAKLVVER